MTAHPYPRKVRQAVAETVARQILVMKDWCDLDSQTQHAFLTDADEILTALWEASRVDAFGDLAGLPGSAIIANRQGNTASLNDFLGIQEVGSPAHIIHWGDQA